MMHSTTLSKSLKSVRSAPAELSASRQAPRAPRACALQVRAQEGQSVNMPSALTRRGALAAGTASSLALFTGGMPAGTGPLAIPPAYAIANPLNLDNGYQRFFGEATSASSYGGYGGNDQGADISNFKYWFDVPSDWKMDIVTKQEKGYLGIDSRWSNPASPKKNFVYIVTFPGYSKLKNDYEEIMGDLGLADPKLQDVLNLADEFTYKERILEDGQVYVDFDIKADPLSVLASVTTYNKRFYAILAWSDVANYEARKEQMDVSRKSLSPIKRTKEEIEKDLSWLRKGATCTMGEC